MQVTIVIEQTFGHPDNPRPTKEAMVKAIVEQLPSMLKEGKDWLIGWAIVSVDAR